MPPGADPTPILNALRATPMFHGVSEGCRRQLARAATVRSYPKGAHLWDEGEPAENLTILLRGHVKVQRCQASSGIVLRLLGPGDPVGAIALHNRMPHPATAICVGPVSALVIPGCVYFDLVSRCPELAAAVIAELTRLTFLLEERLEGYCRWKVEGRIARLLLALARDAGRQVPDGIEIDVPLTRTDIAGLVGTTLETASRVMSRWTRSRLVVRRPGGFLVRSPESLRQLLARSGSGAGD